MIYFKNKELYDIVNVSDLPYRMKFMIHRNFSLFNNRVTCVHGMCFLFSKDRFVLYQCVDCQWLSCVNMLICIKVLGDFYWSLYSHNFLFECIYTHCTCHNVYVNIHTYIFKVLVSSCEAVHSPQQFYAYSYALIQYLLCQDITISWNDIDE